MIPRRVVVIVAEEVLSITVMGGEDDWFCGEDRLVDSLGCNSLVAEGTLCCGSATASSPGVQAANEAASDWAAGLCCVVDSSTKGGVATSVGDSVESTDRLEMLPELLCRLLATELPSGSISVNKPCL